MKALVVPKVEMHLLMIFLSSPVKYDNENEMRTVTRKVMWTNKVYDQTMLIVHQKRY